MQDGFQQLAAVDRSRFEFEEQLLVEQPRQIGHHREDRHVFQVVDRLPVGLRTFEIDRILVRPLVESPDRNTARSRQHRDGDILPAQPHAPCGRLVVVDVQHRNARLPVGRNQTHLGRALHDAARTVG